MARQTTLFDKVVEQAMQNTPDSYALQVVVEKELLHHDILREMSNAGLLKHLTFIGGTCLRAVYGSNRLSEDLDFTGGVNFDSQTMTELTSIIKQALYRKYELDINVTEPKHAGGNVDTWKVKVVTRPSEKHIPMQQINIDICAVPSHDIRYDTLKNHYGVNMGTNGLLLPVQSLEEIFADKIVAMAFRPNRLKHRDLWDIAYLVDKQIECPSELVELKIADHKQSKADFVNALSERLETLSTLSSSFDKEMRRFVPSEVASMTLDNENYWSYLVNTVTGVSQRQINHINKVGQINTTRLESNTPEMSVEQFLIHRKSVLSSKIQDLVIEKTINQELLKSFVDEYRKCCKDDVTANSELAAMLTNATTHLNQKEIASILDQTNENGLKPSQ